MEKIDASTFGITIVDMQSHFLRSDYKECIVNKHKEFLEHIKNKKIPIFVLEFKGKGKTIPEIKDIISKYKSTHFKKKTSNGFESNRYAKTIKKYGISTMLYTGVYADQCVLNTATEGKLKYNIDPIFCEDLMGYSTDCFGIPISANRTRKLMQEHGRILQNNKSLVDLLD
jgi:nicotinamidase-related amidase